MILLTAKFHLEYMNRTRGTEHLSFTYVIRWYMYTRYTSLIGSWVVVVT